MIPDEIAALTLRPGPGSHRTTVTIDGQSTETLADLPPLRDRLLFVGLNPSPVSVEAGHYHQGRLGQTFWRRLMLAGILPPGTPVEDADDALVKAGHGITDLIKRPTAARRGERRGAHDRRRPALAEDRPVAAGGGRLHLQARGLDLGGAAARRALGPAGGRGDGRPAVLPDARPIRPDRGGRRGPQLPAQPLGGAAGRSGLGGHPTVAGRSSSGADGSPRVNAAQQQDVADHRDRRPDQSDPRQIVKSVSVVATK